MLRRRQEILEWLSQPDALQADSLPKFVEDFDAVPYLLSALPIAGAVMGTQAAHELAHRIVAARKGVRARPSACCRMHALTRLPCRPTQGKFSRRMGRDPHFCLCSGISGIAALRAAPCAQVKLGPPLFVPNSNIGTFGAVSQIKSLIRSRADLFDVAFSGPVAAAAVSAALFAGGLVLSSGGVPKACARPCFAWWDQPRCHVRAAGLCLEPCLLCKQQHCNTQRMRALAAAPNLQRGLAHRKSCWVVGLACTPIKKPSLCPEGGRIARFGQFGKHSSKSGFFNKQDCLLAKQARGLHGWFFKINRTACLLSKQGAYMVWA